MYGDSANILHSSPKTSGRKTLASEMLAEQLKISKALVTQWKKCPKFCHFVHLFEQFNRREALNESNQNPIYPDKDFPLKFVINTENPLASLSLHSINVCLLLQYCPLEAMWKSWLPQTPPWKRMMRQRRPSTKSTTNSSMATRRGNLLFKLQY